MAILWWNLCKGMFNKMDGTAIDADAAQAPVNLDHYYIVPDKCTECVGFHDEPQCASVCRLTAVWMMKMSENRKMSYLQKKSRMHQ